MSNPLNIVNFGGPNTIATTFSKIWFNTLRYLLFVYFFLLPSTHLSREAQAHQLVSTHFFIMKKNKIKDIFIR